MKKTLATSSNILYKHWKLTTSAFIVLFILFWGSLPKPLFDKPTSLVVEAADGQLLGAKIAKDGQWRFPYSDNIPEKFEKSILAFEDKRFYSHWGVDLKALGRALLQNLRKNKIVSGGSTLTMQVIRLSRNGKPRTIFQKLVEIVLALRLELSYSKSEILALYSSNAPFGGNVVGLDAASWRYFGKKPELLSWSEAATLAVLPNSPSLIHPGKNRDALQKKRNRLLKKLFYNSLIDTLTYKLATEEPLPNKPMPLPQLAPHLLNYLGTSTTGGKKIKTNIDVELQKNTNRIGRFHHRLLTNNEINNLAILVIDVGSKNVIAYTGNAPNAGYEHQEDVDIIQSARSTGSIMKPLLYAMMIQDGYILPNSIVPDVPLYLKDFRPENYLNTYDGIIPASKALSKSLNIPFVKLLQGYGVEKFHFNLKKLGITTLRQEPNHYGLSLILGGAEANLWDLTNIYASMAHRLGNFYKNQGKYNESDFSKATIQLDEGRKKVTTSNLKKETSFLTSDAIWLAFEAMKDLERPNDQGEWERFDSKRQIAWKTGTSYGFRDAWAIGVNAGYAVGIWAGNADGEGRPGLTGVGATAQIMFDVFDYLPNVPWFDQPYDAMKKIGICSSSGFLPTDQCPVDSMWVQQNALFSQPCPYHQIIYLNDSQTWQVNKSCYPADKILKRSWFMLSPVEEYYFKPKHVNYVTAPPKMEGCNEEGNKSNGSIQLIYPPAHAKIYLPTDIDGKQSKTVFKAIHRNATAIVYWHIDNEYIGSTKEIHDFELDPEVGKHLIVLVDNEGNRVQLPFEIIAKE